MRRRPGLALGLLPLLFVVAGGCITAKILIGREVDPGVLERSLTLGRSTPADVRALLGEPHGKGRSHLPIDSGPRTVWAYVYAEANVESNDLKDLRRTELWVYFDGERYDGYLWFSSFPAHAVPAARVTRAPESAEGRAGRP